MYQDSFSYLLDVNAVVFRFMAWTNSKPRRTKGSYQ